MTFLAQTHQRIGLCKHNIIIELYAFLKLQSFKVNCEVALRKKIPVT